MCSWGAEHGVIAPELLNDAVGFGAHGVVSGVTWLSSRFTHRCSTGSRRLIGLGDLADEFNPVGQDACA